MVRECQPEMGKSEKAAIGSHPLRHGQIFSSGEALVHRGWGK
jgi:hypothetical protein